MSSRRRIALVTVARSDWGIYRSVLESLARSPDVEVCVIASGMHMSPTFGMTVELVEDDCAELGIPVHRVPMPLRSDDAVDVGAAMGEGLRGFAGAFGELKPDLVLVLGDRYEMFCAVAAAVPFVIPVFHIHGGERTAGAIDDALRHAMTKMSHYHFVSTKEYGRRVRQMGEDAWRINVCGAPALDLLDSMPTEDREVLSARLGVHLNAPYALVAFHPTTLEPGEARHQGSVLMSALEQVGVDALLMMPNADPGGLILRDVIREACARNSRWRTVENLRFEEYVAIMKHSRFMIGNSSSGIIEAPSLRTAVVNVGRRQEGRVRGSNVVDVECSLEDILRGLSVVQSEDWRRESLTGINPYYAGGAARHVTEACVRVPLDRRLTNKGFVDGPVEVLRPAEDFCLGQVATVRDVMRCIDRNRCGIALVVDDENKLVTTVTDGDVRRALLRGVGLSDLVTAVTTPGREPVVAEHPVDVDEVLERMRALKIRQMPVLHRGRVLGVLMLDDLAPV